MLAQHSPQVSPMDVTSSCTRNPRVSHIFEAKCRQNQTKMCEHIFALASLPLPHHPLRYPILPRSQPRASTQTHTDTPLLPSTRDTLPRQKVRPNSFLTPRTYSLLFLSVPFPPFPPPTLPRGHRYSLPQVAHTHTRAHTRARPQTPAPVHTCPFLFVTLFLHHLPSSSVCPAQFSETPAACLRATAATVVCLQSPRAARPSNDAGHHRHHQRRQAPAGCPRCR